MKKTIICLLIAILFLHVQVQAQKTKHPHQKTTFGIIGGGTMTTVTGTDFPNGDKLDNDFIFGFHGGINVEIPIAANLYFQPGLQFVTKGAKKDDANFTETDNIYYVEMPLNLVIKPKAGTGHFLIGLGPAVAYGVAGKWKYDEKAGTQNDMDGKVKFKKSWNPLDPNPDNNRYIRPFEVSVGLLVGYQFKSNLLIQLSGNYGLTNIASEIETANTAFVQAKARNIGARLSIGYRFRSKK